jgi:hypothetical protein
MADLLVMPRLERSYHRRILAANVAEFTLVALQSEQQREHLCD